MQKALKKLCKQTITRYAYSSSDRHNDYTWSSVGTEFAAKIENTDKLIKNDLGKEVLSTCQIYCDNDVVINLKDKISSDDISVEYPEILKIDKNYDDNGELDHLVIYTR